MKSSRLALALLMGGFSASALAASQDAPIVQKPAASTAVSGVAVSAPSNRLPVGPPPPTSAPGLATNLFEPDFLRTRPPVPASPDALRGIVVPGDILELASVYRTTMADLTETSSIFHSGGEVRAVVRRTSNFEPVQLQHGSVAYAALVALREPAFVAGVKQYVADPQYGPLLAEFMGINPASLEVAGKDKAAAQIISELDRTGAAVAVKGYVVKQAAYDTQLSKWSLQKVSDNATRLSDAKSASAQRLTANAETMAQLRRIATGEETSTSPATDPVAGPYSATVAQGLALAALIIAGQAGPEHAELIQKLLTVNETSDCLKQAKGTLYACYSVAGPHYEDIFCTGQHSLIDPGMCMVKAAGAVQTSFVAPPPRPARLIDGDEPALIAKAKPKGPAKAAPKKVARK